MLSVVDLRLLILFAISFLFRVAYFALDIPVPEQDTQDYQELACNLIEGKGYVSQENWFGFPMYSWRPPVYPIFLAAIYFLFGFDNTVVVLVQCLLGAMSVIILWCIITRVSARAGWIAAVFMSIYEPLVSVCSEVMSETLFTFLVLLALWALGSKQRKFFLLALGGIAVGLCALTRPVGVLLLPSYVLVVYWQVGRSGWASIVYVITASILVITPWTLRNYQVHGAFVPLSTHGGFIVAQSNNMEPAWRKDRGWGIPKSVFLSMPTEIERDRYWWKKGLSFIREYPLVYARLIFERLLRFFYFFRPSYNLFFAFIIPLFIMGLFRYGGDKDLVLYTTFIAISLFVFSTLLYGSTRFRLPMEPLLIGFGAVYVADNWKRWSKYTAIVYTLSHIGIWLAEDDVREFTLVVLHQLGFK